MKLTHCFFAGLLVTSVACDADDGLESHTQSLVEVQGEQEASSQRLADAIGEEEAEDLIDELIQEEFDALAESELAADAPDETKLPADSVFSATPDTQAAPLTCESSHWPWNFVPQGSGRISLKRFGLYSFGAGIPTYYTQLGEAACDATCATCGRAGTYDTWKSFLSVEICYCES